MDSSTEEVGTIIVLDEGAELLEVPIYPCQFVV